MDADLAVFLSWPSPPRLARQDENFAALVGKLRVQREQSASARALEELLVALRAAEDVPDLETVRDMDVVGIARALGRAASHLEEVGRGGAPALRGRLECCIGLVDGIAAREATESGDLPEEESSCAAFAHGETDQRGIGVLLLRCVLTCVYDAAELVRAAGTWTWRTMG